MQLRSNPPQRDDDGRSYYELLVRRGGEITLTRYRKENGDARRPIAANVTREVLLRLVGDFSRSVGLTRWHLGHKIGGTMLTYEEKLNRDTAWALLEGSMYFEERSAVHTTLRTSNQGAQ